MYAGTIQPLSLTDVDKIQAVDGVAAAAPSIDMMLDDTTASTMGTPEMITGSVPGSDKGLETFTTTVAQGRKLQPGDTGNVVVLGSDLARKLNASAGGKVTIRDQEFEVIGILAPTLTAPDKDAAMPLATAQQLFVKTLPPHPANVKASDLATSITVYPAKGVDPAALKTAP
jgi:ABC-type lipoprotein release transport system permease subunit